MSQFPVVRIKTSQVIAQVVEVKVIYEILMTTFHSKTWKVEFYLTACLHFINLTKIWHYEVPQTPTAAIIIIAEADGRPPRPLFSSYYRQ